MWACRQQLDTRNCCKRCNKRRDLLRLSLTGTYWTGEDNTLKYREILQRLMDYPSDQGSPE